MNLIYTLAIITQTGMTDVAQFQDRDVCMKQALLLKEQKVQAVCVCPRLSTRTKKYKQRSTRPWV